MNDIIKVEEFTLSNAQLTVEMNNIRTAIRTGVTAVMDIAKALNNINKDNLWKDDYKDFEECASQFGIKKAQAYKLIKGYQAFEKYGLTDYNNTQCVEVARLEKEKGEKAVRKALEDGKIKQSMTVAEIKDFVDKKCGKKKALEDKKGKTEKAEAEAQAEDTAEVEAVADKLLEVVLNADGVLEVITSLEIPEKDRKEICKIVNRYMAD